MPTKPAKTASSRTKSKSAPTPKADSVRASEARKLKAGGRRMPGGVMPEDAARALEKLQKEQYAPSASACIFRALVDAADRLKPAASL